MPRLRTHLLPALLLACAGLFLPAAQASPELLHSEPSRFGKILVFEENGERCMNFNSMVDFGRQTCQDVDEPGKLVFSYTRMMISALYVKPDPASILIVGLGGATLQKTLAELLPGTVIDTVEIDPAVGKVAEAYFGYRPGPRQRLGIHVVGELRRRHGFHSVTRVNHRFRKRRICNDGRDLRIDAVDHHLRGSCRRIKDIPKGYVELRHSEFC